jgi:hypothetical protein
MRRGPLMLIALLPFTTFASAQTPAPPPDRIPLALFGSTTLTTQVSPDVVVDRVMSFDRDHDGRVTRDELPDRMHNLLSDATGGSLDSAAVRARAMTAATATVTGRGFQGSGGGYTFGDRISLSTRPHVEGALDDLRLPALTREQAQAIVTPFMEQLEADSTAKLVADLHFVLTVSQLTSLRMQIERQLSGRPGAPNHVVRSADGKTFQVFMGGPDLTQRINAFGLPPEQTKQALAAFESFKERIRPGDAERSELLEQLKDVLNDEERDNFRAALARRPLVKSGLPVMMAGVTSGVVTLEKRVVPDGAIDNALFIMPKTAAPAPQLIEP